MARLRHPRWEIGTTIAAAAVALIGLDLAASSSQRPDAQALGRAARVPAQQATPSTVTTYSYGHYSIHIQENPGSASVDPAQRSVLILGTFSDAATVERSKNYINPSTGRRFDVVIGLGSDNKVAELERVVVEGHLNADRNAAALRSAVIEHFGQPLAAGSIDTHSNGTTVGVAAVSGGTFRNVKQLNLNGPDIGYGGTYINEESFSRLKGAGVQNVTIYRAPADVIPALGELSQTIGAAASAGANEALSNTLGLKLGQQTARAVQSLRDVAAAPASDKRPQVRLVNLEGPIDTTLQSHFAENYLNTRAGLLRSPSSLSSQPIPAAQRDPMGVRIAIDDEILARALRAGSQSDNQRLFLALARDMRGDRTAGETADSLAGFADVLKARFKETAKPLPLNDVVLVSLRAVLKTATEFKQQWASLPDPVRHPGPMSRIYGYVVAPELEDVVLVGELRKDEPLIELDDLIVGIRSVFKDGRVPFCSLDPDPSSISGPQKVRLDGVPADSGFALTMLNADYAMKRIMLGFEPVSVSGYRTLRAIWSLHAPQGVSLNRFWLYPFQPQPGEIQMTPDRNSALFMGGVQVLSEQMIQTRDGLAGSGTVDSDADDAAASFTSNYGDLARTHTELGRLRGLFDIVLMARLWQFTNVVSPTLDRIAQLPYRKVVVPEAYTGLHDEMRVRDGRTVAISGGVHANSRSTARSLLAFQAPDLVALRDRAHRLSESGAIATRVSDLAISVIAPDTTRRDSVQATVNTARAQIAAGDFAGAGAAIDRAMASESQDPELLALRSLVNFGAGAISAARSDALLAQQLDPDTPQTATITATILFKSDIFAGDSAGALRSVEWGLKRNPTSVHLRVLRSEALMELRRFADAKEELLATIQLDPTSPLALARLGILEMTEGWLTTAQRYINRAAAMAEMLKQNGPEIAVARALAAVAAGADGDRAKQLGEGRRLAESALQDPARDPRTTVQALIVLAGTAILERNWKLADEQIERAKQLVPDSPDVLATAGAMAHSASRDDVARRYLLKAQRIAPNHPAVVALAATMRTR